MPARESVRKSYPAEMYVTREIEEGAGESYFILHEDLTDIDMAETDERLVAIYALVDVKRLEVKRELKDA